MFASPVRHVTPPIGKRSGTHEIAQPERRLDPKSEIKVSGPPCPRLRRNVTRNLEGAQFRKFQFGLGINLGVGFRTHPTSL